LTDIVQNHFSPRIDDKTIHKLERLTDFFNTYKIRDHSLDFQELKINIKELYRVDNQDALFGLLSSIKQHLENYRSSWETLKDKVKKEYAHTNPPKEWKEALRLCDWLKDTHCKVDDYVNIIASTSTRNIVKNPGKDQELVFNCLEESYMMHKYFHKHREFTVLMSATFGDPSEYLKGLALKNAKYLKMDNSFDFERSPIYYYNKHRMSYKEIERNLPWLYDKVDEILDKHKDENGIIHSVSYDLCMKIYNNVSNKNKKRILVYSGTEEKQQVLDILKKNKNKVVVGPSLLEGIDLFDNICRFIIFAKVPYLSLGDKFVKAKMNINHGWYQWKSVLSLIQGFGRGIRHKEDYCCGYILDACFSDLFSSSRKSFSSEFINRIKTIPE
jgi:Rad3-related DNA helicase